MEEFDPKQYKKGKRDFWLFTVIWVLYLILTDIMVGPDIWLTYVLEVIIYVLLYQGYMWVLYFQDARLLYGLVCAIMMLVKTVPELYWIIYAYPTSVIISQVLGVIMVTAMCIILMVRKNVKYIIKIKQLKRKGKLDAQILSEINNSNI